MLIVPLSGFSWPVIMRNSVVLPAPFGPITPTMPPGGSLNERSSISSLSPKPFERCVEIDDIVAEPLGDRDDDLRRRRRLVVLLGDQIFVALDARLGFRLPRLRARGDPFRSRLRAARWRASSSRPSWARRFCFCFSQAE